MTEIESKKPYIENIKHTESLDKLREHVENSMKPDTLPFKVSWVPIELFKELDCFCKETFHNDRVAFMKFLWENYKNDTKYKMLNDKVDMLAENCQVAFEDLYSKVEPEVQTDSVKPKKRFSIRTTDEKKGV